MKILVTGANGFIAKNLIIKLTTLGHECIKFIRADSYEKLENLVSNIDFIYHLAGATRPDNESQFFTDNTLLTEALCIVCHKSKKKIPIVFSSSIQVFLNNTYGLSKQQAEKTLLTFHEKNPYPLIIFRLTNIFGKLSQPNYTSVVATFCFNAINNLPLVINKDSRPIKLMYIDDLVNSFISYLNVTGESIEFPILDNFYEITVERLAELVICIKNNRPINSINLSEYNFIKNLRFTYKSFLK